MKHCIQTLTLLLSLTCAFAQKKPSAEEEIQIREYTLLAEKSFKTENYKKALEYYLYLDSIQPNQALTKYNIGVCYLNSNYKAKSLPYLLAAQQKKIPNKEVNYLLAQSYHHNHKFDLAKKTFKQYLTSMKADTAGNSEFVRDVTDRMAACDVAKELMQDSTMVEIENMGPAINTVNDEYVPIVSADQQIMYFTTRRLTKHDPRLSPDGRYYEDIFVAEKDSLGKWKPAQDADAPLNGPEHDACIGITPDAQTMYIYRMKTNEQNKGKIFISKLNGKTWSKPTKLGQHINTKKGWESSVSISQDKRRLYFSSDRAGGYGNLDIWYSELQPNNEWGEAINAGPTINTQYDEDCPFIHFDNKTLFFSSNGKGTMGGFDVFSTVATSLNNTWTKPRNLGYPINSTDDDTYFVYSADGSKGYMSSSTRGDSYGERDLYVVNRPNHSKHMIVLNGQILDEEKNTPVEATITVTDLEKNEVVGVYASNAASGKYALTLDFGKNYSVQFEADNFIFHSENVNVNNAEAIFTDKKTFKLKKIKAGNSLVLNNIFFDKDKFDVKNESLPELDKLLDFMQKHPHIHIEISGHTDSIGNKEYNTKLSLKRANSVKTYLETRGVASNNLRIKGLGSSKPVASNSSEDGRKQNRRTECLIYDMDALPQEQKDHLAKADTSINNVLFWENIAPSNSKGTVLNQKAHFLYKNGAFMTEFSKHQMEKVVAALRRFPKLKLELVGYTDVVGEEYNNKKLHEKRVHTILNYFAEKGLAESRFIVAPYKESTTPKIEDLSQGNAENRKVEFKIVEM